MQWRRIILYSSRVSPYNIDLRRRDVASVPADVISARASRVGTAYAVHKLYGTVKNYRKYTRRFDAYGNEGEVY